MRYFIDYDSDADLAIAADPTDDATLDLSIVFSTATVIAQNVVDFQIWFRSLDPLSFAGEVDLPKYHSPSHLFSSQAATRPDPANVVVGDALPQTPTANPHISPPSSAQPNVLGPEHMRSAIVTLSIRGERSEQFIDTDSGNDISFSRELEPSPDGDVGMYKTRRYYVEAKLPNIMSQMSNFQMAAGFAGY